MWRATVRERSWVRKLVFVLASVFLASFIVAPSASAACFAGSDYIGVAPTGPIKVGDAPYPDGVTYSVPQWYGYGAPPITSWYVKTDEGIINPVGALCSSSDLNGLFNQGIPQGIMSVATGLLGIDYFLLELGGAPQETTASIQENVKDIVNSGPYKNLYNILVWLVIALGVVTVFLLVLTQDQRDRSDLMAALTSGGTVRSRRSAAIKEIGWIIGSVAMFGAIIAGLPYAIQKTVSDVAASFSIAIQGELVNFNQSVEGKGDNAGSTDICKAWSQSTAVGAIDSTGANTDLIACNLYRIYQWTPWLAVQFGGTDAGVYRIDTSNPIVENSESLKSAIALVEKKFGTEASVLAPYLQMQILRGNNNEGFSGVQEMSTEERISAFRDLGIAIDTSDISKPWAQFWAGQGEASWGRVINSLFTLFFVGLIFLPLTAILLANVFAGFLLAILPILGIAFALLIGVRQWRKKGMKILKWWLYALLIPPIVTFGLAISVTATLMLTNLMDFSGYSLFIYLLVSSISFIGVLYYIVMLFRKSAKDASQAVDGSQGEQGMLGKAASIAAPVAGNIIAPGIGGAIGGAVAGSVINNGSEPRPEQEYTDETPALNASRVGATSVKAISQGSSTSEPRALGVDDDDEIYDAEIIEDNEIVGGYGDSSSLPVAREPLAITATPVDAFDSYGEEPRVGGENTEPTNFDDGKAQINQVVDEGVQRVKEATITGAAVVDFVAQDRAATIFEGAANAAEMVAGAGEKASGGVKESIESEARLQQANISDEIRKVGQGEKDALNQESESGKGRLFRTSKEEVEKVEASGAESVAGISASASVMSDIVNRAEGAASDMDDIHNDMRETSESIEKAVSEPVARKIRNRQDD
jgi:hypothetical protein